MTRKERKQKRRQKRKASKPVIGDNDLAWAMAKIMTAQKPNKEHVNNKVYCEVCKQAYCLGNDNVDQFCRDCYYMESKERVEAMGGIFTGCQKELIGRRVCKHCGG